MYDKGECGYSFKPFYYLVEAAIKWCQLQDYEYQILRAHSHSPQSLSTAFPHWPHLSQSMEKLADAIANHDLVYGELGVSVTPGTRVPLDLVTIRHHDLKAWMTRFFPAEKPPFLFDTVERSVQPEISIEAFQVLKAELLTLRIQLVQAEQRLVQQDEANFTVSAERDKLRMMIEEQSPIGERGTCGYESVIGAMLQVIFGQTPTGKSYSVFENQESLVTAIVAHCGHVRGISKRSLDSKFAAGRRRVKNT
jgi:hypothetical protein